MLRLINNELFALSRNPIPVCLVIDECEAGLVARLRRAQKEDEDLKEKLDWAERELLDGYTVQGGLLQEHW